MQLVSVDGEKFSVCARHYATFSAGEVLTAGWADTGQVCSLVLTTMLDDVIRGVDALRGRR